MDDVVDALDAEIVHEVAVGFEGHRANTRAAYLEIIAPDPLQELAGGFGETLAAMPDEELFDFAFIDADKQAQLGYYEEILRRLRPGGVIVMDNTLLFGSVVESDTDDEQTRAVQRQNRFIADDERVETVMVNVSDGLGLIRKL